MQDMATRLLISLCYTTLLFTLAQAQTITEPPKNIIAALGTNVTFSCRGNGQVIWEIGGTQVVTEELVELFAKEKVYAPLPTPSVSQLIITATETNNFTRSVICLVDTGNVEESDPVRLLVYAEPHSPSNLDIAVDGLNLVATWTEPFSLDGEEISYVISITNMATGSSEEHTVNETRFIFSRAASQRDCQEYEFTVFSQNSFSKSNDSVSGKRNFPTEPLAIDRSEIQLDVSLTGGVSVTISFKSQDPCPSYPVTSYTFNITERDSNTLTASIRHTSALPLLLDSSNGLVPDQVYRLVIEAENVVGSTLSEEIIIYTTGLQSSSAVIEQNGSIAVTCTFATGASSTGCQVTILESGGNMVLSRNITRQNGEAQVIGNIAVPTTFTTNTELVLRAVDLQSEGKPGNVAFDTKVILNQLKNSENSNARTSAPSATTSLPVLPQATSPDSSLSIIAGVVTGIALVLILILVVIIIVGVMIRRKYRTKSNQLSIQENPYLESPVSPAYNMITDRVQQTGGQESSGSSQNGQTTVLSPVYAEIRRVNLSLNNRATTNSRIDTLEPSLRIGLPPLSPHSDTSSTLGQIPSPYLVPVAKPSSARAKADNSNTASSGGPIYHVLERPSEEKDSSSDQVSSTSTLDVSETVEFSFDHHNVQPRSVKQGGVVYESIKRKSYHQVTNTDANEVELQSARVLFSTPPVLDLHSNTSKPAYVNYTTVVLSNQ